MASNPASRKVFPEIARACNEIGLPTRLYGASAQLNSSVPKQSIVWSRAFFLNFIPRNFRPAIKHFAWALQYLLQFLLDRPSAVIVADDRSLGRQASAAWAAQIFDIPIILLPVAYWLNDRGLLSMRLLSKNKFLISDETRSKFPVWQEKGETYRFYSVAHEWVMCRFFGMKLNPWKMGLGYSTHICCESHIQEKHLLSNECAKEIRVTGNIQHDLMFRLKNARNKDLVQHKILIALPQFYEHDLWPRAKQQAFVNQLVDISLKKFGRITIALHPSMEREDYSYLASERVTISDEKSEFIIPHHNVLISTYSSLVVWMKLCGGAVILLDPLGMKYPRNDFPWDFLVESLPHMEDIDLGSIEALIGNDEADLAEAFCFDGQALQRTSQYILEWANG